MPTININNVPIVSVYGDSVGIALHAPQFIKLVRDKKINAKWINARAATARFGKSYITTATVKADELRELTELLGEYQPDSEVNELASLEMALWM
jgi:sRNA-binding carbon storage regulator CsrA